MRIAPRRIGLVRTTLALWAGLALAAACDDETGPTDPADTILSMRVTVENQTVTVNEGGTVTGGPIRIQVSGVPISATFISAAGVPVGGLDAYELRVTSAAPGFVTFSRLSAFSGTLTRVAPGATALSIGLWHNGEGHFDFGPFNVPIIVQ